MVELEGYPDGASGRYRSYHWCIPAPCQVVYLSWPCQRGHTASLFMSFSCEQSLTQNSIYLRHAGLFLCRCHGVQTSGDSFFQKLRRLTNNTFPHVVPVMLLLYL